MSDRGVLEVDTPVLSRFAATEPSIEPFETGYTGPGSPQGRCLYLHTSPEYFMKRLLAAASGPIYQVSHVFRNGELGPRHNPEFSMLEWYRPGVDHVALMDEMDDLLAYILGGLVDYRPAQRMCYRQWLLQHTGLDPWKDDVNAFREFAGRNLGQVPAGMEHAGLDTWLDLLVSHWLQPRLPPGAVIVYDYPPTQAALACLRESGGIQVAERFELYIDGMELANGFHELTDAREQLERLRQENRIRSAEGRDSMPIDRFFIDALDAGMPESAGVALGLDRLVMYAGALKHIDSAMPFSFSRA
jgi:lysyl-tRNA synthetase class 2